MSMHGWEHYDLGKEIARSNMAMLLELFKREHERYTNKCVEYVNSQGKLTEEGKKELEKECDLINEGCLKISFEIAERLTNVKKIQYEILPKQ